MLIKRGTDALAVPFRELRRTRTIRARVGREQVDVVWRPGQRSPFAGVDGGPGKPVGSVVVRSSRTGAPIQASTPFWFAVTAFHPRMRIWTGSDRPG